MTFDEIVTSITSRLNLTSADGITRVRTEVNDRYRRVTSSIGLNVSRRTTVQATAIIGVNTLAFSSVEKLINVVDRSSSPYRVLKEVTMEELRAREPFANNWARYYAIANITANTVTILMDCIPEAAFTLYADAYSTAATLTGSQTPAFSESFHDILMYGVLADEYRKVMKQALAQESEAMYEKRLSELRYFISKSAYLDRFQGKTRDILVGSGSISTGAGSSGGSFDGSQSWTQTGLITFDRTGAAVGSRYPFAVAAGSERVRNLKIDVDFLQVQIFS